MGNECCGQTKTKHQIVRTRSGKILNRFVRKQRKFRTGLHVEKTSEMGAEANFQAALTTDISEKYTREDNPNADNVLQELPQQQNNRQEN